MARRTADVVAALEGLRLTSATREQVLGLVSAMVDDGTLVLSDATPDRPVGAWQPGQPVRWPRTAQDLAAKALDLLPRELTWEGVLAAAQVHATLAVAAAVREADPHSSLQRVCDMLNELRTTV